MMTFADFLTVLVLTRPIFATYLNTALSSKVRMSRAGSITRNCTQMAKQTQMKVCQDLIHVTSLVPPVLNLGAAASPFASLF